MTHSKGITNEDYKAKMSDLQHQLFELIDELMVAQDLDDDEAEAIIGAKITATRSAMNSLIAIPSSIRYHYR